MSFEVEQKFRTAGHIGFADRRVVAEGAHIDPPRTWGVRGVDGPIRAVVDVHVEPLADRRARLTIVLDFEGHGIGKILVPLFVRRAARREMPAHPAMPKDRPEEDP